MRFSDTCLTGDPSGSGKEWSGQHGEGREGVRIGWGTHRCGDAGGETSGLPRVGSEFNGHCTIRKEIDHVL